MNISFNFITNNVKGLGDKKLDINSLGGYRIKYVIKGLFLCKKLTRASKLKKNGRMNLEMEMNFFSVMVNRMQEGLRSGSVGT